MGGSPLCAAHVLDCAAYASALKCLRGGIHVFLGHLEDLLCGPTFL